MTPLRITVARVPVAIIRFHPHNVRRDLGDLRGLANSIQRFGVMQPVTVERMGQQLRLRDGHRRVTAAKLAGARQVPAIIHAEPLDEDEWITASLHTTIFRRGVDHDERRDALLRLVDLGCTKKGLADSFGVTQTTIGNWLLSHDELRAQRRAQPERTRVYGTRLQRFADEWQPLAEQGLNPIEARALLDQLRRLAATGNLADQLEAGAA